MPMDVGNSSIDNRPNNNNFDYSKVWALYKQKGKRILKPEPRKSVFGVFRTAGERGLRQRAVVSALEELGYHRDTVEHYVNEGLEVGVLEIAREDKKKFRTFRYYRLIESLRGPVLPDPVKKPAYTWIFDKLDLLKNDFLKTFGKFSDLTCDSGLMYGGQMYKIFLELEFIKNKVKDKTSEETLQILDNLSALAVALKDGFAEYAETGKKPCDFYEKISSFLSKLQDLYNRAHKVGERLDAPG